MTPNPNLLRVCGTIGLICAGVPIVTDIISWFLARGYSPVENSISKLAVGPSSWMMDVGLWVFAAGCVAAAIGLWAWRVHAKYWTGAILSLVLLAICVVIIAGVNEYAGPRNEGTNLHLWAVCGVGVFFALTALLALPGLRMLSDSLARFSMALGVAWVVLAPLYWFAVPDGWNGAFERLLALMMLAWLAVVSQRLRRSGERAR